MDEAVINEAFLESKPADERTKLLIELAERVETALHDVSPVLKVMICLEVATTWAIGLGASRGDILQASARIYDEAVVGINAFGEQVATMGELFPEDL